MLILPAWASGWSGPAGMISGHVYSRPCGAVLQPAECSDAIPDLRLRFDGSDSHEFYEVTTDHNGAYSVSLPAGAYVVEHVWVNTDAANRPIVMHAPPDSGPTTIMVAPGLEVIAEFGFRAGSRP
jgi:hypothetical protein